MIQVELKYQFLSNPDENGERRPFGGGITMLRPKINEKTFDEFAPKLLPTIIRVFRESNHEITNFQLLVEGIWLNKEVEMTFSDAQSFLDLFSQQLQIFKRREPYSLLLQQFDFQLATTILNMSLGTRYWLSAGLHARSKDSMRLLPVQLYLVITAEVLGVSEDDARRIASFANQRICERTAAVDRSWSCQLFRSLGFHDNYKHAHDNAVTRYKRLSLG